MKRSLPTHIVSKGVRHRMMKLGLLLFTFCFLSIGQSLAQGQRECMCLDNGSNSTNGQFGESILVNSAPGETWTVVSISGFFSTASAAPPAAPTAIPPGTPLTYNGAQYVLDGIRQPGTMWTVEVTNGVNTIPFSSFHVCNNPSEAILGDFDVCMMGNEVYTLEAQGATNIVWSLPSGGSIVSGQGTRTLTVDWDAPVGVYEIAYTAQAPAFAGQVTGLCDISNTEEVSVMNEDAFALACNNLVNIGLNGSCNLQVTADMVLEDMRFTNSSYDVVFRDIEADTIVTGPIVGMEYVNKKLEVKVIHDCSGNSCWGFVVLEDKAIPPLTCPEDVTLDCSELMSPENTGFPVPATATVTKIDDNEYLAVGFDLCSDVILTFDDVSISENLCDGPYSSIVRRTWFAEDNSGNSTSCSFLININRATLDDITFPPNYDDVLGPNPSLAACSNFPLLENGNPDTTFTGTPNGTFCLNVHVSFEDIRLGKCGDKTYKVRRRWTVTDLCTNADTMHTQSITVMDNEDPVVNAPAPYTVGTGDYDCSSIIDVKAPSISDCSETTYTISYKAVVPGEDPYFQPSNAGVVLNGDGTYTITQLPTHDGQVYILYYVVDACGNRSQDYTTITVVDDVEPVPVCDLHTFVGLGDDGIAYAGIDAFDDGSWDNCSLEKIEVRRMNTTCGSNPWGERVKFCCADVGNIVMVSLRVTDKSGNSNFCMVEAEVQDNHAPEFTFCPPNITIDCEADVDNLDQYGIPTATDNCNVTISPSVTRNINQCGEGTITRRFTAEDNDGNTAICTQRITVRNLDPFFINPTNANDSNDDVIWPANVTLTNGCAGDGILPENLPSGRQEPIILNEGCSAITFNYEDVVFQYVDEACLKVLRTWTVIDDCRYFPPFGTIGIWKYTQVIKIENSTKPTFVTGCNVSDITRTSLPNCETRIQVQATATDDCTPSASLKYSYTVDEDRNGTIDFNGNGNTVNRIFDFGNHRITWSVEDQCGNIETCNLNFTVDDEKAPTPYCLSEIVTVIMAENGTVEIWASDFDAGSFDDCTDELDLRLSFSQNTNDTRLLITCDQMSAPTQEFDVELWVTDESGNADFCTTSLIIQDNQDVCGNGIVDDTTAVGTRVMLAGHIFNENNDMLSEVELVLESSLPEFPRAEVTDTEGAYAFNDLLNATDYQVSPNSAGSHRDGVNTLDLIKIQRHILGLEPLNSPYKIIASDINNDERITPSDLLQLRKLILGIYTEFPKNDSWRFVDAAYEFADPVDPFPFEEGVSMAQMQADYADADFIAVKVGDVDGSASGFKSSGGEIVSRSATTVTTEEQLLAIGYNEIHFAAKAMSDVYGMQLVLAINEKLVSSIEVVSQALDIKPEHYRYESGKLYISVGEALPVTLAGDLFYLKVTTRDEAYVSDIISLEESQLSPELFVENDGAIVGKDFSLEIEGRSLDVEHGFELFQNVPNPFTSTTDIAFVLPAAQQVKLTVMDITGKVVTQRQGHFVKGYNVITLDVADINASGIMHYKLDTETDSDIRKMIIIK